MLKNESIDTYLPKNHPFAAKSKLRLKAIDGQSFIERTNCSLYSLVEYCLNEKTFILILFFVPKGMIWQKHWSLPAWVFL